MTWLLKNRSDLDMEKYCVQSWQGVERRQVDRNGVGKGIPDKRHGMCRVLEVEVHEGILTHVIGLEHGGM